jgi:hypothetical protein
LRYSLRALHRCDRFEKYTDNSWASPPNGCGQGTAWYAECFIRLLLSSNVMGRRVYFEVPLNPSDADINDMLDLLAEDSSDAAPDGTLAVVPLPEVDTTLDVPKPVSTSPETP